ncbi:MAG: hypothetical protein GY774_35390 [Planctomycetes bacterium]|nr:hypothetical protein [Planctomycetota bacterium]
MKRLILVLLLVFLWVFPVLAVPPSAPTPAKRSKTDVTNFDSNLSPDDDTVQKALDTLDEVTGVGDSTETNQDDAWSAVSGGTETGIDVTYQDATDDVDFVVDVTPSAGNATIEIADDAVQVLYDASLTEGASGLGIAADAISEAYIADDGIDSEHYNDGSIDAVHLAADIIDETKIADDGIDSEHYNDGSIDAAHLAADIISEAYIADDGIDSEHYNDGSIDLVHLAAGVYAKDLVTTAPVTGAADNILVGADSDVTVALDFTAAWDYGGAASLEIPNAASPTTNATGEIALNTDGTDADFTGPVIQISTNGATVGYIPTMTDMPEAGEDNYIMKYDAASNLFVWEADADTGGAPALSAVTDPTGVWSVTMGDTEIVTWTLEETDADPVIFLADGTFGDISIVNIHQTGNATNGTMLEVSTDDADVDHIMLGFDSTPGGAPEDYVTHTIANAGTYTIDVTSDGTAAVSFPDIVNVGVGIDGIGAVDMDYGSVDITDHTFVTDSTGTAEIVLPAGSIDGTEILDDTVDSDDYAAASIDAEHLAADIVSEAYIADDGIDSEHYNDGSIDAVHLAADIIEETKIADDGIDSEHYNDGSIDLVHLAAGVYAVDIVTTAPVTGATDNVLVGADADVTIALDFTAAWIFTGSVEIPNGASPTTDATGEIALNTDGTDADYTGPVLQISTNDATMGYIPTMTDMPEAAEDNYIMKYDAASNLFVWEEDSVGTALGTNLSSSTDDLLSDNGTILLGGTGGSNNLTIDLDFETSATVITATGGGGATTFDFGTINLATDALDLSTGDITNVGQIDADTIIADGAALAIGDGTETIAIDSSDWNISATGDITNVTVALDNDETLTNPSDDLVVIASNDQEAIAFDLDTATDNEILITGHTAGVTQIDIQIATLKTDAMNIDGAMDVDGSVDGANLVTLTNTDTDIASEAYILVLQHNDDADAEADFILAQDDADGTPATMFLVEFDGDVTAGKDITSTGDLISGDDVTVGDDLVLSSDSAVISIGAGADSTITHDGTTGLDWAIADNDSGALVITESSNAYLTFVTTNGSEAVQLGKKLTNVGDFVGDLTIKDGTPTIIIEDSGDSDNVAAQIVFDMDDTANDDGSADIQVSVGDTMRSYIKADGDNTEVFLGASLDMEAVVANTNFIEMNSNTSVAASGNRIYFKSNVFTVQENGSETEVFTANDTTIDMSGVTNIILGAASQAATASGEIGLDTTANELTWHDGTKVVTIDTTPTDDNYVLKYDNASATFTLEADETGGTPAWESVTAPTSDVNLIHPAGVETQFTFTGNFSAGNQFNIEQLGGTPTGGVLLQVKAANSNVTLAQLGDGTNYTQISQAGNITQAGTATATFANATTFTGDLDIDFSANTEEINITADAAYAAGSGILTLYDDSTGQTSASYLIRGAREADADAQDHFLLFEDNSTGAAANGDDMFVVDSGGVTKSTGGFFPMSTNGAALGSDALDFSDLWLADGAFIDFDSSDVVLTHSAETLTLSGGALDLTSGGITNVGTIGDDGAITLLSSGGTVTVEGVVFTGNAVSAVSTLATTAGITAGTAVVPDTDGGANLGATTAGWAVLHMYETSTINWNNGDVVITHATNDLNFTGVTGDYNFDDDVVSSGKIQGATYGSDGTVSDAELLYINSLSSNAQTQITAKAAHTSATLTTPIIVDGSTLTFDESAGDPNDADVALSAADGVFAITSVNGAFNEDFKIDTDSVDNTVVLSSTAATEINASALQLVTTGDIMGAINVSSKAGAYTIGTDDAHENFGTMFTNSNVADLTLPATTAVVGASGCLMQEAGVTGIMQLEPGTGSHLVYEGVEMNDGTPLASAGAATDRICWVAISADHYLITSAIGTWAE